MKDVKTMAVHNGGGWHRGGAMEDIGAGAAYGGGGKRGSKPKFLT